MYRSKYLVGIYIFTRVEKTRACSLRDTRTVGSRVDLPRGGGGRGVRTQSPLPGQHRIPDLAFTPLPYPALPLFLFLLAPSHTSGPYSTLPWWPFRAGSGKPHFLFIISFTFTNITCFSLHKSPLSSLIVYF